MAQLADLSRSAALGFESGKGQSTVNPLGQFIRSMLAQRQQQDALAADVGAKSILQKQEYKLKSQYPDPLTAILAKQYGLDLGGGGATTPATSGLGVTGLSFGKSGARVELGETPGQKQTRELETKQQERGQQAGEEMSAVDAMAESIWSAADKLIPAEEIPAKAEQVGMVRKAKTASIFGIMPQRAFGVSDENALAYKQMIKAEATPFMRALGEKGMMTNQDIQRGLDLTPGLSDSKKLRQTKKEEFSKFIKSKIKAYHKGSQANISFATEAEAEAANLPSGTVITIGGRQARVR